MFPHFGYHICPICERRHSEQPLTVLGGDESFMGFLLCPDDQRRALEGFVALVEVLDSSADEGEDMFEQLCAAQRTGNVHYIQRARWYDLFDRPEPATPMVFIEPGVTKKMQLRARLTLH